MKNLKLKINLAEIKGKLKKHAPELILVSTTIVGTVGWIITGVYARRLQDAEYYDPKCMLIVPPDLLREVCEESATLTHWIDGNGGEHFQTINEDGTQLSSCSRWFQEEPGKSSN